MGPTITKDRPIKGFPSQVKSSHFIGPQFPTGNSVNLEKKFSGNGPVRLKGRPLGRPRTQATRSLVWRSKSLRSLNRKTCRVFTSPEKKTNSGLVVVAPTIAAHGAAMRFGLGNLPWVLMRLLPLIPAHGSCRRGVGVQRQQIKEPLRQGRGED